MEMGGGSIRKKGGYAAGWKYSKSPTYERVPFREHVHKSGLFVKSNKVSLGTHLTQSAIEYCAIISL